jgi:hypothetical protein
MAKLVDALALGASGATHGGSSPLPGTIKQKTGFLPVFVLSAERSVGGLEKVACYFET